MTIFKAGRRPDLVAGFLLVVMLGGAPGARAAAPPRPAEFDICQGCHGVNGQGNAELGAPRIAGLDAQYIGQQLANFRDGRRGAGDSFGPQMVAIAAMLDDTIIGRLSAYVSAMPEQAAPRMLKGDERAGRAAFVTCAACHGPHGEGNAVMGGPRLAGMSDWYLVRQLSAFASGKRGTAAGDERGATMRAIAESLKSERAVRDVISYAASLQISAATTSKECGDRAGETCGSSP
ncbi:c-type cytochrome [Povalibacter sp.]|uniref:c-type cytochrome n=1 Tax=Povalibacter sp. TaxID=1962978 RepID=UPI002F3FD6F0